MPRSVSGALRRQPAPSGWRLFSVEHPISAARAVPPARSSRARSPCAGHSAPGMSRPPLVIDTALMAELRAAQAEDVGAISAIDPRTPAGRRRSWRLSASKPAWSRARRDRGLSCRQARPLLPARLHRPAIRRTSRPTAWVGRALVWSALQNAPASRVFTSTNGSNAPMRELLRSEGWHLSEVLTGLDEGDPEHVFFHDAHGSQP